MVKPGQALITYPAYTTTGTAVVTFGMMNIGGDPVTTMFKCFLIGHDTGVLNFFNADGVPLNIPVTLNQTVTVTVPSYFYVGVEHFDEAQQRWLRDDTIPFLINTTACQQCETLNQSSCVSPCSWWANNGSVGCHSVNPATWIPTTQCCGVPCSANTDPNSCTYYQCYYWSDGTCNATEQLPGCSNPSGNEGNSSCGDAAYGQDPTHRYLCQSNNWIDQGYDINCANPPPPINWLIVGAAIAIGVGIPAILIMKKR